jgi:predicted ester cyclase
MNTTEIIRRYVDAWNGHDASVLIGAFTKHGVYCGPDTDPGVNGEAFATFAKGLWTAFPDFNVELLTVGEIEAGVAALHWRVSGTNSGPGADESKPTGRTVSVQGASIVRLEGDKIRSEYAYFDRKRIEEQLATK